MLEGLFLDVLSVLSAIVTFDESSPRVGSLTVYRLLGSNSFLNFESFGFVLSHVSEARHGAPGN